MMEPPAQAQLGLVHEEAGDNGRHAEEEEGAEYAAVGGELAGDDVAEGGDDEYAEEEYEPAEGLAGFLADKVLGHELHGSAVIAYRGGQRQIVVDGADKDVAEPYPEQAGEPAPGYRHGGSHDGAGAGDGGEVVAEEHELARGHIVYAVIQALRRRRGR
jgi:hypothetical protein